MIALAPGTEAAGRSIPEPDCDIPVRVYRPLRPGPGPRPLIVYFHGGGFVFGDLRPGDWLCSSVAAQALAEICAGQSAALNAQERQAPKEPAV